MGGTLAPTAQLESPQALLQLAGALLQSYGRFSEKHSFTRFVAENSTEVELADDTEFATKFNSIYETFAASFKSKIQWGVGLKEKEAAGYHCSVILLYHLCQHYMWNFLSTPSLMQWICPDYHTATWTQPCC